MWKPFRLAAPARLLTAEDEAEAGHESLSLRLAQPPPFGFAGALHLVVLHGVTQRQRLAFTGE